MAGWSMISGGNCPNTPKKKLEPIINPKTEPGDCDDNRSRFIKCLKLFRRKICALDVTFPPMLGNGQSVDLFKLYLTVREKGGYDAVSRNGLWDVVADLSGFGVDLASSVKLVYAKYLDALEKWLERAADDKSSKTKSGFGASNFGGVVSADLGFDLKGFLDWKSVLDVCAEMDSNYLTENCVVGDEESSVHIATVRSITDFGEAGYSSCNVAKNSVVDYFSDEVKKGNGVQENIQSNLESMKSSDEDEGKSVVVEMNGMVEMNGDTKCDCVDENGGMMLDSDVVQGANSIRKRKRESVCKMLKWITAIARDPCDDAIASLPEWPKWDSYGNEELWKQVLLTRESLFLKRNVDKGSEQSSSQKNRKMHPCMYDDNVGSVYNFRERLKCSRNLLSGQMPCPKATSTTAANLGLSTKGIPSDESSSKHSLHDLPAEKSIPLGPDFQAKVPEWSGVACESDPKWVGSRIWPPQRIDNRFVVERDPIGKGRQDSCGCGVPKSIECVRFHTTERRMRMKRELGMAFYLWRFDMMGEDVKGSWTKQEEKKFEAMVRSNPPPLEKCYWHEIAKTFRSKVMKDLVSYYFNVFLVQRRAQQNRLTPNNIDSDDDESECRVVPHSSSQEAPKSPASILCSAKKSRKSGR